MKKYTMPKILFYHLYPGVVITLFFVLLAPVFVRQGWPPQLAMLISIPVIVTPLLLLHLVAARKAEKVNGIMGLVPYREKLSTGKLIGYTLGLVVFAYVVYGAMQPVNEVLTQKLLFWLPDWYKVQDFQGYPRNIIIVTLILNLLFNGLLAPIVEELYFRGYLLPRMKNLGKLAPLLNAVLFSLYHFWQPQIYLTLMIALLPMTYLTWKTKSIRLAIYTHCGLNLVGALISFAMLGQ